MLDFLKELDTQVFLFLNSYHTRFLDILMWWISDKLIWIPLYIYLLYRVVRRFGWESIAVLLSLAILIALSDQTSGFIKNAAERLRPSHNPDIKDQVLTLRGYFGGSYGFVSSHAANSFALAYFMYKFLNLNYTYLGPYLFVWAFIVSYSRIYLGVHYPGDILGGALVGLVLAWMVVKVYQQIIRLTCFSKQC